MCVSKSAVASTRSAYERTKSMRRNTSATLNSPVSDGNPAVTSSTSNPSELWASTMLKAMVIPTRHDERRSQSTTAGMSVTALKTEAASHGIRSRGLKYYSAARMSPAH